MAQSPCDVTDTTKGLSYGAPSGSDLAAYKIPRQIEIRDELPKSAVLKILRRELREQELARLKGQAKV